MTGPCSPIFRPISNSADVAASDDNTGHSALGGDWDLEYSAGEVETAVAFSDEFQLTWTYLLPANTAPTWNLSFTPHTITTAALSARSVETADVDPQVLGLRTPVLGLRTPVGNFDSGIDLVLVVQDPLFHPHPVAIQMGPATGLADQTQ